MQTVKGRDTNTKYRFNYSIFKEEEEEGYKIIGNEYMGSWKLMVFNKSKKDQEDDDGLYKRN